MKVKELIDNLNKLVSDNPKAAEYEAVYSADDEGNYYGVVNYKPSVGFYSREDKEFYSDELNSDTSNAVCVN